jgi:hypothetical protein
MSRRKLRAVVSAYRDLEEHTEMEYLLGLILPWQHAHTKIFRRTPCLVPIDEADAENRLIR